MSSSNRPVKVLRVIARLNVGGPAIQAITLTEQLTARGYETVLVRGRGGPREGSMDGMAAALGISPVTLPALRREVGRRDLRALGALLRLFYRHRPQIVHTHAAKAGTLGRLASLLTRPRPITVHTFHGHVLEGYFSARRARFYQFIERNLAAHTTRLIAVSQEVKDDLVRLGVAGPENISVVPLGFELSRFVPAPTERDRRRRAWRRQAGVEPGETLVTLVARLVPIKRVDRFLAIADRLCSQARFRFLVVGDGELRDELAHDPRAVALGHRLLWRGFTTTIEEVYFASDIVVLTSDNEGTPVSLIEAAAAGLPVVSTDVGGVRAVVLHGRSGYLVDPEDEAQFARQILRLADDSETARRFGAEGRAHAMTNFKLERLVSDLDALYQSLLRSSAT